MTGYRLSMTRHEFDADTPLAHVLTYLLPGIVADVAAAAGPDGAVESVNVAAAKPGPRLATARHIVTVTATVPA